MHSMPDTDTDTDTEPVQFWNQHYGTNQKTWGGRANPVLVEVAGALTPGTALDLGCGGGGDALWLARHGWRVTAVDISTTAVDRVRAHAVEVGLGELVTTEAHDLARSFPTGTFDLISAQYFHTPFTLPRAQVLRTAAHALAPGGLLLVVDHGSTAPWSWNRHEHTDYPTPDEVAAELDLDPARWSVERADAPGREATGPAGETALVTDHVLVVSRQ